MTSVERSTVATTTAHDVCALSRIPEDIWLHVLTFLEFKHLFHMERLSRQMRLLASDDSIWKQRCLVDFGEKASPQDGAKIKYLYKAYFASPLEIRSSHGCLMGQTFEVKCDSDIASAATLGRSRQNTVCMLRDDEVSRHHAQITYDDGKYLLVDKRSANGSYVNNTRMTPDLPHAIKTGDVLVFARSEFIVVGRKLTQAVEDCDSEQSHDSTQGSPREDEPAPADGADGADGAEPVQA
jgi:hypothetical protein